MGSYEIYCIIRTLIDTFLVLLLKLYHGTHVEKVQPTTNALLLESAVGLARKIRNRKVKSYTVVQAYIDRIKEVNPLLNAMVDDRFQQALNEAEDIDRKIENNLYGDEDFKDMPFLGIPFTTKETTSCEGLSWTYGLISRKGIKGSEDATCVQNMKKAGGILLGVTNVPELNMWVETFNKVYGTTNNPYDTRLNVGGSSGGEGSIIAGLGSPFGIGTDIGGSIRIPAFRCGIFGHKPTNGIISTKGLTFRKGTEGPTMVTAGPMTKFSEDLIPLLKVLSNNSPVLNLDTPVDLKRIKIFYTTTINCFRNSPITKEVKEAVTKCVRHFKDAGSQPEELNIDGLKHGVPLWSYMSTKEEGSDYHLELTNRRYKVKFFPELLKFMTGRSEFCSYTILVLLKKAIANPDMVWAEETLAKLKKDLLGYLGDDGVLIMPPESHVASYHYRTIPQPTFGFYFVWSALKFPVTQVPLGLNHDGIPLGVQVVTTPNNDRLSIAIARELENAFGGYTQPC